ncbi:chemotaxis protein CheW [Rhodosalinus sp. FB01]|uniref:chemotaxis protein CheW n=1 Tax=Rhodosalinus sp. FB01 TaxID=3239194 RepID=UPI003525EAE6
MTIENDATDTIPSRPEEQEARAYVVLSLDDQLFVLDVAHVREILDMARMSPLPGAGSDVLGLIDLRGRAIEVADLAVRLGLPRSPAGGEGRILVLDGGGDRPRGLRVDRVESVIEIAPDAFEPAEYGQSGGAVRAITRIDGRLALALDGNAALGAGGGWPL